VILEPLDPERPVVEIRAEGVELRGLTIRGGKEGVRIIHSRKARLIQNTITSSGKAIALIGSRESRVEANEISGSEIGILLDGSHNNDLWSNKLHGNAQGIILKGSHQNRLYANRAFANRAEGILLKGSNQNELIRNVSRQNPWGLLIDSSQGNVLRENRFERNMRALRVWGSETAHFLHKIEPTNTIDGRPIFYLVGERSLTITSRDRPGWVALINSKGITVEGISLGKGVDGLLVVGTQNSTLRSNVLTGTSLGIYLLDSRENELISNRVEGTEGSGITLVRSHGNLLVRNQVLRNGGHGVFLEGSSSNRLMENHIEGNRESGIHIVASRKAELIGNRILSNWVGIFLDGGGAHLVKKNRISESQFGIFVHESTGNRFLENLLEHNRHDTNAPGELPPPAPKPPPGSEGKPPSGGG